MRGPSPAPLSVGSDRSTPGVALRIRSPQLETYRLRGIDEDAEVFNSDQWRGLPQF